MTGTFTQGQQLIIDARAVGVGVAAVALWFRVPAALAMLIGVVVCALLRCSA